MKKMILFAIFFLLISLHSASLYAEEVDRELTVFDKFSRGAFNLFTFPLDIPYAVYKVSVDENPIAGLVYGFPAGTANSLVKMVSAVVDLTMAPFPPYEPVLKPVLSFREERGARE